jgi:molybdopterin converting factor subunit 1
MNSIHVSFFAAFREQAGTDAQTVRSAATSAGALFEELRGTFPALESYANMKFAVNDQIVDADHAIKDGDRVLFFPPVAGG